jgi:murein DD-endopeptidase MepM/ murein hydrolase activator NlpD
MDPFHFFAILAIVVTLLAGVACFVYPLQPPVRGYTVSSPPGWRVNPMGGGEEGLHRGIDIPGEIGTPILATGSGVVLATWPVPGTPVPGKKGAYYQGWGALGAAIIIDHGGGLWTIYGHLSRIDVRQGQRVETGKQIGLMGMTGKCTGPHLHWELVLDPRLLFPPPVGIADRARKELPR